MKALAEKILHDLEHNHDDSYDICMNARELAQQVLELKPDAMGQVVIEMHRWLSEQQEWLDQTCSLTRRSVFAEVRGKLMELAQKHGRQLSE